MWPRVVYEVTNVPEKEIRMGLKNKFSYSERGRQQCSVRQKSVRMRSSLSRN